MSDRPRTIRVLVHLGARGSVAIGILRSIWAGAHRVDSRLKGAFPIVDPPPCPDGVDPDLWLAHCGLRQAVTDQVQAYRAKRPR